MASCASKVLAEVIQDPLILERYTGFVQDDGAGAIATFTGVTRDNFDGKRVVRLDYEAYALMAEKKLQAWTMLLAPHFSHASSSAVESQPQAEAQDSSPQNSVV